MKWKCAPAAAQQQQCDNYGATLWNEEVVPAQEK